MAALQAVHWAVVVEYVGECGFLLEWESRTPASPPAGSSHCWANRWPRSCCQRRQTGSMAVWTAVLAGCGLSVGEPGYCSRLEEPAPGSTWKAPGGVMRS